MARSSESLRRLMVERLKPHVPASVWRWLRSLAPGHSPPRTASDERARRLRSMTLTELAPEFDCGKWGLHRYTPHFEHHFSALRDEATLVLECGIGYSREGKGAPYSGCGGASSPGRRWSALTSRTSRSSTDPASGRSRVPRPTARSWSSSCASTGAPTIIIDDGSHWPEHVVESFKILFPMLAGDGLCAIEDIQTSHWPQWGGRLDPDDPATSMAMTRRLLDGLNYEEFLDPGYEPTHADRLVVAVHCYHNLVLIQKGENLVGSNKRSANRQWYRGNA